MAIAWHRLADPKVKPSLGKRFVKGIIARCRARKKRQDTDYAAKVRAIVAARDGYCRYGLDVSPGDRFARCAGPSEWAHFGEHARCKTRGMAPQFRHTTTGSLMLCRFHHSQLHAAKLVIVAATPRGCDGRLRYREIR